MGRGRMFFPLKDCMDCISQAITGKPLDAEPFARQVLCNGGYDMHEISVADVKNLLDGKFDLCDREKVLWAFNETVNFYQYAADTPEDLCSGIFTLIVLCRVAAQDKEDFSDHFNKIIEMYYFFHQRIDESLAILLFSICFANLPEYPEIVAHYLGRKRE